jgi:predicted TIM-barrel fold metal-dependent hydrolase
MGIIDAHTHVSLDGRNDKSVANLLKAMDTAGIEQAMVFAATIADFPTETLLKDIAPHRDRLHAVAAVSPFLEAHRPSVAQMDEWLGTGAVRAIKYYTGYEHFYPAEPLLRPYMDLLVTHDRPAIFHSGDCYNKVCRAKIKYAHPLHIDDLAVDMPDLKIVIAHFGSPWILDCAQVVYKNTNVYTDCSGFVYGKFVNDRREFFGEVWADLRRLTEGSDKILFGTDWPISDMADYVDVVGDLACEHYDAIMHDNAKKLFGL